ncbi:hypothetical protein [Microbacterium deminutum]|uniref:Tfp pilus assembly protein PilO n=1 Tax=Microbacterium deminutum TaxID=344164 RepID=A0ABP5BQS7_9MICO
MPKQLINVLGVVVCVGILALAIALVAVPVFVQSIATGAQSAVVAHTNELYQSQVDSLQTENQRIDEVKASVAALRTEIPATNRLDDVFELVASAAAASGVSVESIAAGENAAFAARTEPLPIGDTSVAPAVPLSDGTKTTSGASTKGGGAASAAQPSSDAPAAAGDRREQVDFTISVVATELDSTVRFLDALRAGPRLLSPIQTTVTPTATGWDVTVAALTFVLPES